jgi:hypothetical protein
MVQTDAIIWKDPNSNELERGIIILKNDTLTVNDRDSQTIINCPINDLMLTYATYIHQPEDRLIIDLTYKDDDKGVEYTIRPEGMMKEFLKLIYKLEDQSIPMNISPDIKLARNPKFMPILTFVNFILLILINDIIRKNPDILKIGILQMGGTIHTQFSVFGLLFAPGLVTITYARILYTKIHGLIRYFQIIGPIKSHSPYTFNQGIKYYRKLSIWLTILVIINLSILITCYVILILYSQLLIGLVLFLLASILPAKLLYTPIKFLLTKKDLQYYVGDYF